MLSFSCSTTEVLPSDVHSKTHTHLCLGAHYERCVWQSPSPFGLCQVEWVETVSTAASRLTHLEKKNHGMLFDAAWMQRVGRLHHFSVNINKNHPIKKNNK